MRVSFVALVLAFIIPSSVFAFDQSQLEIASVSVEKVDEGFLPLDKDPSPEPNLGQILDQAERLIAFGEKIYKLIERGRPVVNTTYAPINVLPQDKEGNFYLPRQLESWSTPKFTKWRVSFKSKSGKEVIAFTYNLNFSYGGRLNGKGQYLSAVQIVPEEISVGWGYKFESVYELVNIVNHGRADNALAGATLRLKYEVSTVLKKYKADLNFHVKGNGEVLKLN